MDRYPLIEINSSILLNNTKTLTNLCSKYGIKVAGVVKGINAIPECCDILVKGGCEQIASSRIDHLHNIKDFNDKIITMLIRIPMFSEIPDIVSYADISLVSEKETLVLINNESKKQGKIHKVVLMYDLGDLREGVFTRQELINLSLFVENNLDYIELFGIGTNLSCYGSIKPSNKNLTELSIAAEEIEKLINRELNIVSGGATTVLPALIRGEVPKKINHLRLGESIVNTQDLPLYWNCVIDGLNKDAFILKSQIVELNSKPTYPIGERGVAAFGKVKEYIDNGIRKRAIIAIGNQDLGDCNKLIPKDKNIKILGASGDHTILDIEDCSHEYKLGDIIEFNILYQAMVYSTMSPTVYKKII